MKQVDTAVRRETLYIAAWVLVLSVLMQAVFLVIGRWDYSVLLGNLLGGGASVGNFFLLGLMVQKAAGQDPAEVALRVRRSQGLRMLGLLLVAVIGWFLPCFSIWTTVIPFLFPRIAIAFWPLFNKEKTE